MADETVRELNVQGWSVCLGLKDKPLDPYELHQNLLHDSSFQQLLDTLVQIPSRLGLDQRTIRAVKLKGLDCTHWLSVRMQCIADRYLLGGGIFLGTQIIGVRPNIPRQAIHCDHSFGPRCALSFGISLDPNIPFLNTLLDDGVHYHERITEQNRLLRMKTAQSPFLVFDTYLKHAGAGNSGSTEMVKRLFFTYVSQTRTNEILTRDLSFRDAQVVRKANGTIALW